MTRNSAILLGLVLVAGPAAACISSGEWQHAPGKELVENSDSIYFAQLVDLDPVSSERMTVVLDVPSTIKGESIDRVEIEVSRIVAYHPSSRVHDEFHESDAFWHGKQGNARMGGGCRTSPVEFYEDGEYLVFTSDGQLVSAHGFERITDPEQDKWYQFVIGLELE